MLEQPSSGTLALNVIQERFYVMVIHCTIMTSAKHDKQSQSLADINVCPPKTRVGSRDLFNVLHREMQTSGMLGFIGNYNRNVGYM